MSFADDAHTLYTLKTFSCILPIKYQSCSFRLIYSSIWGFWSKFPCGTDQKGEQGKDWNKAKP